MKLSVGFITYGESTAKYLPYFLPSLQAQTDHNFRLLAVDNSQEKDNKNSQYIRSNFPYIKLIWPGENLGFAKAFNIMIGQALAQGAEYFLVLNPDMILEADFIEKMVEAAQADGKIGAVAPKILKWDFENNVKTGQIDSLGLTVTKEHRFFDAHQGATDDLSADAAQEVFGFTGAAALLNLKALADVAFNNGNHEEYFDELMFMYKEDCDLSYRLRLAGWKIILAPEAVAYHNRTVAGVGRNDLAIALNRKNKSKLVKEWSFLNQWILLGKFKNLPFSLKIRLASLLCSAKVLVFVSLFEPYLLKALTHLWAIKGEIKKRREQLKIRIGIEKIEKFMD
ncbi:MAG: glycosyltransferase family 2 protein [Patescibacteria group bacterium]|nr:glycosyltransferase family 2 protein [Patescibacteria group bacterium]